MKSDAKFLSAEADSRAAQLRTPILAASLAVMGIVVFYWSTAASAVAIWARSETFVHCFIVVPISLWLAWRRRSEFLCEFCCAG